MANHDLQSIGIATTLFVFLVLFGTALITSHVNVYDVNLDPTSQINDYSEYTNDLSTYKDGTEDEYSEIKITKKDTEGVLGTFATIKKMFGMRDIVSDVQKDAETTFWFLPVEVWNMIGIILGIIFISLIAGIFWRNSEGLNG